MKSLPFSKIRTGIIFVSFLIVAGGVGYRLGEKKVLGTAALDTRTVVNTQVPTGSNVDFGLFWDVWGKLTRFYVDPQVIDVQKLVYGAISGMVSAVGDPYTSFFPPKENKEFKQDLGGEFEGIGAQLGTRDSRVIVVSPLKDQPAEKAGLKPNDVILKVDGEDTAGWTVEQAVNKIRGPKGTSVKLSILHEVGDKPIDLTIERATIMVPSVTSYIKTPSEIESISGVSSLAVKDSVHKIAYLDLSRFGDHTNDDWDKAVNEISQAYKNDKNLKGMVFDLRNNPGGYLEGAVYIASDFINGGTVVSQVNSDGSRQDYKVSHKAHLADIPLVVLVNKGSASAAEIVSGALKDYGRAKLIGDTTFGKGTVQTPFELSGGSSVHITTGKWLLPKGDSISQKGITPDIEISLGDNPTASGDGQLVRAIEELLK